MVKVKAYAKLTLGLEVLGKRSDGYHELKGVFQAISLHDTLSFEVAPRLSLAVDSPALAGPGNLVLKAAQKLAEARQDNFGAAITLSKGIPWGAGLGGGSADAAATLRGLNQLWELEMPRQRLEEIAAQIGSDVPFCLVGGTALVEGRGERVTPLPTPACYAVLVCPPFSLKDKTREMFAALRPESFTAGQHVEWLGSALLQGEVPSGGKLFNAFEPVAWRLFPGLEDYRRLFRELGASGVHLAGSGPVLFALERDLVAARELSERLRREGLEVLVGRFMPPL